MHSAALARVGWFPGKQPFLLLGWLSRLPFSSGTQKGGKDMIFFAYLPNTPAVEMLPMYSH